MFWPGRSGTQQALGGPPTAAKSSVLFGPNAPRTPLAGAGPVLERVWVGSGKAV